MIHQLKQTKNYLNQKIYLNQIISLKNIKKKIKVKVIKKIIHKIICRKNYYIQNRISINKYKEKNQKIKKLLKKKNLINFIKEI